MGFVSVGGPWGFASPGPILYDNCSELWVIGECAHLSEIETKQGSFLQVYVDLAQPRTSSFSFILKIFWGTYCVLGYVMVDIYLALALTFGACLSGVQSGAAS